MVSNAGIYAILNVTQCKIYIGSSKNVKQRIRQHIGNLKHNKSSKQIQHDYNNGDEFKFTLLSDLGQCCTRKQFYYELCYINAFKKSILYNSFKGVIRGGWRGGVIRCDNRKRILNNVKPMKVSTDSIASLCQALNCQPSDIMEYIE